MISHLSVFANQSWDVTQGHELLHERLILRVRISAWNRRPTVGLATVD